MSEASDPVTVTHDGDLAVVRWSAPPLNLFDEPMFASLEASVAELESDLPRALLFASEGKVVSAGVDVRKVFDGLVGHPDEGAALWRRLIGLTRRVEALPCPTVFAAHGLCLTAAFELSLGCDLILAAESARFGLVEVVVGLTPSMGGTQRLVERAGPGRARELVMTGELFDAATLERWNVVNRVLPDEGFAEAAHAFAARLAAGPTRAHAATKGVVRATLDGGVDAGDEAVIERSGALFGTEDLAGAVQSFLEQGPGKATYSGR